MRFSSRPTLAAAVLRWSLVVVAVVIASCGGGGGQQDRDPRLELLRIEPRPGSTLRLNDEIRLTFDETLDPTSLTGSSISLVDTRTGDAVRGRWISEGKTLRFAPAGVRAPDLSNGGYAPGATLGLTLGGFPRIASVRAADRRPLAGSLTFSFDVTEAEGTRGESPLRDMSPAATSRLYIRSADAGSSATNPLEHDAPLVLACKEPIDPRTLRPGEFVIVQVRRGGERDIFPPRPSGELDERTITRVRAIDLIRNSESEALGSSSGLPDEAAALLRVEPEAPLPLRTYGGPFTFELRLAKDVTRPTIADFSGGSPFIASVPFFVARFDLRDSESDETYEFDFLDTDDFAPFEDRSADGTAAWAADGTVSIRYPAAAGEGTGGNVKLSGDFDMVDLHATRLRVAANDSASLTGDGLVVLRSQGRVDIDGELLRVHAGGDTATGSGSEPESGAAQSPMPMWNATDLMRQANAPPIRSLSDWLEEARERNEPWTVIIAGGDLVVHGKIDVDTPLLLVAGGRIRGSSAAKASDGQLWILGEGGFDRTGRTGGASPTPLVDPPLAIDPPVMNLLRTPLTFVAYSSPAPKSASPQFWNRATVVGLGGPHGAGKVEFIDVELPRGNGGNGAGSSRGAVEVGQAIRHDQPMGVVESATDGATNGARVRMRIELVVRPFQGEWQPPFIDRVLLSWTPEPAGR